MGSSTLFKMLDYDIDMKLDARLVSPFFKKDKSVQCSSLWAFYQFQETYGIRLVLTLVTNSFF